MQRRGPPAPHAGSAQGLAVDADHALYAEALAELVQDRFQTLRVQRSKDVAERIVAGYAVSEFQEPPQQLLSALAEELALGARLGASQRRRQGDDERVAGARVLERSKHAPEFAHAGLLRESGDTRRIQFAEIRNTPPEPYAIPLPRPGTGDRKACEGH